MDIFKTASPDMGKQPEMRQSSSDMAMMFPASSVRPEGNVKVAQSYSEAEQLMRCGSCGDMGARSVEHVERPRYGHKV